MAYNLQVCAIFVNILCIGCLENTHKNMKFKFRKCEHKTYIVTDDVDTKWTWRDKQNWKIGSIIWLRLKYRSDEGLLQNNIKK